jgi:hypothetical protein
MPTWVKWLIGLVILLVVYQVVFGFGGHAAH